MKKILLLIPALNAGGAERVIVNLANSWSKNNDVTIMVFNNGNCFYQLSNKVKVIKMNIAPLKGKIFRIFSIPFVELKRYFSIYKEIKRSNYNFILSFCFTTNIMASIVSKFQKDKEIFISERNDPTKYSKFISFFINSCYKWPKCIICKNDMVKEYFIKHKFNNNLIILPNPVNFDDIPKKRPDEIKKEIVTVGRLIPQKNQKLLIDAFKEISDEFPEYILKIYGIGPLEKKLKEQIKINNLENKVFLMGTRKKIMYEVSKSSIFVLPSDFEGFPNVLIEAMGTGMPVISSDFKTGIAKELIKNENCGYLFEVNNKNELADCMRKLLNREDELLQIGNNNIKIAQIYEANYVSNNWILAINDVINSKKEKNKEFFKGDKL